MSDYAFIQARHFTPGRIKPVQLIVIHSAETQELAQSAENVAHYFATTDVAASVHYAVDADSIVQCVRLTDTAWHCKNANANGIGIEHAGRAIQTREQWLDDYGQKMLDRSARLCADLCKRFNIPASFAQFAGPNNPKVTRAGFCGHVDVPLHGTHSDPGTSFPYDWFLERVVNYLR